MIIKDVEKEEVVVFFLEYFLSILVFNGVSDIIFWGMLLIRFLIVLMI